MFKIFYIGIACGAFAAAAVIGFVPAIDQHREPSLIFVEPNGGNREIFHINLPQDRILAGMAGLETVPPGLAWPATGALAGAQAELFKIRDGRDAVVGVASRMAGADAATGAVVEWMLHLPARGSIYVTMQPAAGSDGYRSGSFRAGTREFAGLHGRVIERHLDVRGAASTDAGIDGRIELVTALVRAAEPAG